MRHAAPNNEDSPTRHNGPEDQRLTSEQNLPVGTGELDAKTYIENNPIYGNVRVITSPDLSSAQYVRRRTTRSCLKRNWNVRKQQL